MKLDNGIMRPARVLQVVDNRGTIKVESPGLFPITDPVLLPPVYPLFMFGTNSFSTPIVGQEVWVMNFSDNDRQLYWFRKDNMDSISKYLTDDNGKIDIVLSRDTDKGWGTLYFSDGSGWVMSRDGSKINIDAKGNFYFTHPNPNRTISITPQGISLGKPDVSDHTACYADELIPILNAITDQFDELRSALLQNPYTCVAGLSIVTKDWKDDIDKIESPNVTLQ